MAEGEDAEEETVTQFLIGVGLECLIKLFSRQKITMDILKEMTSDNLKEAGIQEYGYRHKIIKEVEKMKGISASSQRSTYQRKRKAIIEQQSLISRKKRSDHRKRNYPVFCRKSMLPRPQIHKMTASTQTSFPPSRNYLSSTRDSNIHGMMQTISTQNSPQTITSNNLINTITTTFPVASNSQFTTRSNNQTTLENVQSISTAKLNPLSGYIQGTSQSKKLPSQSLVSLSVTSCSTSSSSTLTSLNCSSVLSSPCSSHLTLTYDNDDAITEDENRFLRFYLLAQLGTDALRMAFDNKVPPSLLASHLQTHKCKLLEKCASQRKVLFPGGSVSTKNFDTTLLYALFRNTLSVTQPSNGWGNDPFPYNTSLTDDVERVRIHRNSICHGKTSMDLSIFQRNWSDLSEAIFRLSNGSLKKETSSLETRKFDKKARKSIMDDFDLLKYRVSELEQTHIPAHIKERQTDEVKLWEEDDEVFCETRAYKEFEELMNIHNVVTIIGGPGTGKTAKARHLAIKYKSEGWEIIPVICLEDIKNFGHSYVKQIFLYDDPAGVFGFDRSRYNSLVDFTKTIKLLSEKQTKFIFTCRKSVYYEGRKLDLYIFQNTIDIENERISLLPTEMKEMLTIHCEKCKVEKSVYQSLSLKSGSVMFPLLCKLFSKETQYQKEGKRFFEMPKKCLIEEFQKMKLLNKIHYASLVLCVLSQNRLNMQEWKDTETLSHMTKQFRIEGSLSDLQVCDALNQMNGTYVIKIDEIYAFVHDSIFEVMAYMYGREFPEMIISKMNSGYISRCVRLRTDANSNLNSSVIIPKETYSVLAERLYLDIKEKQFYDVFQNECLKELSFIQVFIEYLHTKSNEELAEAFLKGHDYVPHLIATEFIDKVEEGRKYIFERLIVCETYSEVMTDSFMVEDEEMPENITTYKTKYQIRALNWVVAYGHEDLLKFLVDKYILYELTCRKIFGFSLSEQSHLLVLSTFSANSQITKKLIGYLENNCIDNSPSGKFDSLNIHMCFTPLTAACIGYNCEIVDALLDAGADINKRDDTPEGDTPLTHVAKQGNEKMLDHLIKKNANIDKINGVNKSPLYCASYFGHFSVVQNLLTNDANINICDAYNKSPLFIAAEKGFLKIVEVLVNNGADITICENNEKKTALFQSINNNYFDISRILVKSGVYEMLLSNKIIDLMLSKGFDLNVLDSEGRTIIQWAIQKQDIDLFIKLIDHGAKIDSLLENEINSILSYVSVSYDFDVLKIILKTFDQPRCPDIPWSYLHLLKASAKDNIEAVKFLLNRNFHSEDRDEAMQKAFTIAINRGNLDLVRTLVVHGVDLNISNEKFTNNCTPSLFSTENINGDKKRQADLGFREKETPLHIAIRRGHPEIVKYLVENGANINLYNHEYKTPLHKASEYGNTEIIMQLVEHGDNINLATLWEGEAPLHIASEYGHTEIVKYLLRRGAKVNVFDIWKKTPLSNASENGHKDIVKHLVEHGAKVNVRVDWNEATSLYLAAQFGHKDIVKHLIENNARVNDCDLWKNETPLLKAAQNKYMEIVKFLLEHGADVNLCDRRKRTPLHYAAQNGCTEIVKLLVQFGGKINLCDNSDKTPLQYAEEYKHIEVLQHFIDHGANIYFLSSGTNQYYIKHTSVK
ncbi:uncharacterized protein LOC133192274 [Saccostrea echinata]|uniref:uncharacterized protein LOC133192274 n=1 Tax=Saccostrea echinata TaxID=191078 RepID=UPI002A80D500|nr:uncharacterized protein LOC133192274 [Saccostrea echinata]